MNQKIVETADAADLITLENSFPNPLSTSTIIGLTLEKPGNIRITIWDVTGRMIREVSGQFYYADRHTVTWNAADYASGIYLCQLEFKDRSVMQKMVLLKQVLFRIRASCSHSQVPAWEYIIDCFEMRVEKKLAYRSLCKQNDIHQLSNLLMTFLCCYKYLIKRYHYRNLPSTNRYQKI